MTFKQITMLPLAAGALLFAGVASANEPGSSRTDMTVKKIVATGGLSDRSAAKTAKTSPDGLEVRDWARIDINKDHLISPDEMVAYLEASRATVRQ